MQESDSIVDKSTAITVLNRTISSFWNDDSGIIKDMSHFYGCGRFSDLDRWHSIGKSNVFHFRDLMLLAGKSNISDMIEWGVGGGANAFYFANIVQKFYGIDISKQSLIECQKILMKVQNDFDYKLILLTIDNPEQANEFIEPVDFFLCTSVYQHFPNPDYADRITKIAYSLLKPNGIALIQIKYGESAISENYPGNFANFMLYPIDKFWVKAAEIGFTPLSIVLDPSCISAFFYLVKR